MGSRANHSLALVSDWKWQARHAITDLAGLEATLRLSDDERRGAERALAGGFPLSITPYYASLCDVDDPGCPIRRQCVPSFAEAQSVPGDLRDPLGEEAHEPVPHLIQRYPDRVLLLVTDRCSVYCRFCTRSRMVGAGGGVRPSAELQPALDYIRSHPEIHEVILSGGDPLLMSDQRLQALLVALRDLPDVMYIRVATRTPVTLPQRITGGLCRVLRTHPSTWLMTHFNHPKELSDEARTALSRLVDHGIPVMNQTVLLRGINDDEATLAQLFRDLVRCRTRPYYLLQTDPVIGTGHLRTSLTASIELFGRLQGRLSGIALPKLIVDTPGGLGKVPVGPETIVRSAPGITTLRTFRGQEVDYIDPPCPRAGLSP